MKNFFTLSAAVTLLVSATQLLAYGPTGHQIVGAIADELLAKKPAGDQVRILIDGITLEKAAVMPDEIKAWDKKGPDDLNAFPHYRDHPKIDGQLRDFWRANPPSHEAMVTTPSHHWFHYTDVPLLTPEKYGDGKAGRSEWDIVHMIPYCVSVLKGETPEDNPRKITKPIAILLLAHYLGDLHQPLHVGAEYFDQAGHVIDPDNEKATSTAPALEDQGGNTLTLRLNGDNVPGGASASHSKNMHGYWDQDTVAALLPPLPADIDKEQRYQKNEVALRDLAHEMATHEPKNWRLDDKIPLKDYAEAWANQILPIAREAHERLQISGVHAQQQQERVVAAGIATEKSTEDHVAYREWASQRVREELHLAGWRLADLLEKAVGSAKATEAAPVSSPTIQASQTPTPSASSPSPPETSSPTPTSTPAPTPTLTPTPAPAPSLTKPSTPYGAFPADYKEVISAWMKARSRDPSTIDWQTQPRPAEFPGPNGQRLSGYLVIFNTRATTGPGIKTHGALIHDGRVIDMTGFSP